MENIEVQERIKKIEKSILTHTMINAPAMIAIGIGIFAKITQNGESLHPLLGSTSVLNGLLILGVPVVIYGTYKMSKLSVEKKQLMKKL